MPSLDQIDRSSPILVVDDFSTMRRIIKNCLFTLGFENVLEAEDGEQALTILHNTPTAFVISDWAMPNMMGLDLLRAMRSDDRLKTVPFVMLAAEPHKDGFAEASKAGASSFILKPFTPEIFRQKLELVFK